MVKIDISCEKSGVWRNWKCEKPLKCVSLVVSAWKLATLREPNLRESKGQYLIIGYFGNIAIVASSQSIWGTNLLAAAEYYFADSGRWTLINSGSEVSLRRC